MFANVERTRRLIRHRSSSMDLLHAADAGKLSRVRELVANDASLIRTCRHQDPVNRAFNVNGSAIHYACRSGHFSVVKYLLEQDPTIVRDIDIEHWTPLHYACYNGHVDIVRLLLEYNADVDAKDSYLHKTPVEFAMYKQFEDVVNLLQPTTPWIRRDAIEIVRKGNMPVFRTSSRLFLGRYRLDEHHRERIESFRKNPQSDAIELNSIEDNELNGIPVRIRLTHDFDDHARRTMALSVVEGDDRFLRSSTTSTNEHIIVVVADQMLIE